MAAMYRLGTLGLRRYNLDCFKMIKRLMATMAISSTPRASQGEVSSECSEPDVDPNDDKFRFTRGRFISNEEHEMSQRYVRFNLHELGRLAAEAVGSKSCVNMQKYPDGTYNKALLLTMDDGAQAVAKVPNPNAGRPHFTTASEVATMEFVQKNLGTPVPKVYAWSSRAQDNPVGAEYIIMEKVSGVQLGSVWNKMELHDQFKVAKAIAKYQEAWMALSFEKLGSLYYVEDLDGLTQSPLYTDCRGISITDSRFAVGPSTGRELMDDGRSTIELDRGPWKTVEEYQEAIGHGQIACVQSLARLPTSPVSLFGPGTYQPTRENKIKALKCYLAMIKHLLPTDQTILSPCIWHPDLHCENIFVDPENPTEVVGIIDWQSVEVAPLYNHARQPFFLDYEGPPTVGLERPCLPENLAQLDPAAQAAANVLFLQMSLSVAYKTLIYHLHPRLYRAMNFSETKSFEFLLFARNIIVDGEAYYLAHVMELEKAWAELPGVYERGGVPFPFQFSAEERAKIEADALGASTGMAAMRGVKEALGGLFPKRWIARHDRYEKTRDALQQVKEQVIEMFAHDDKSKQAWQENWPFDC